MEESENCAEVNDNREYERLLHIVDSLNKLLKMKGSTFSRNMVPLVASVGSLEEFREAGCTSCRQLGDRGVLRPADVFNLLLDSADYEISIVRDDDCLEATEFRLQPRAEVANDDATPPVEEDEEIDTEIDEEDEDPLDAVAPTEEELEELEEVS
jgi:hypothetical protein